MGRGEGPVPYYIRGKTLLMSQRKQEEEDSGRPRRGSHHHKEGQERGHEAWGEMKGSETETERDRHRKRGADRKGE
jgi:hypothetical protein